MPTHKTWGIRELADELGITPRSIRFYEEKGLLVPKRTEGEHRLFDRRDRTRLKLILRGKRFGLTLDQIADILGLAATDMDEEEQIRKALLHLEKVLDDLAERKKDIEAMQRDLLQYVGGMRTRLAQITGSGRGQPY